MWSVAFGSTEPGQEWVRSFSGARQEGEQVMNGSPLTSADEGEGPLTTRPKQVGLRGALGLLSWSCRTGTLGTWGLGPLENSTWVSVCDADMGGFQAPGPVI